MSVHAKTNHTEEELTLFKELKEISQKLFDEDNHDFLPLIKIDFQGYHNSSNATEDRAPNP